METEAYTGSGAIPEYVFTTDFLLYMFDYMSHTQAYSLPWGF